MEQNQNNYITLEMNLKLQMKDYRLVLGVKRAWIIALVVAGIQRDKMIRRLTQGLYEYPREHEVLGLLPPQVEEVRKAIAEKNGIRIQPSGAYAANLVRLSEQVPGRIIFLTNGPSKKVKIGKLEIIFRATREKTMHAVGTKVGLVIQALKKLGKDHVDDIARACEEVFERNNGGGA